MKIEGNKLVEIIDWILRLPIIRIFNPLYEKFKAFWIYCFLGVLSVLSNIVLFYVFTKIGLGELISNIIAWILSTIFSYYIFGEFYFGIDYNNVLNELSKYASGRIFTLILEELLLFIFVTKLKYNMMLVKFIAVIITAFANYFISKLFVFKKESK